jgi:nucleoside-diphosphate-sugar epimerase
MSIRSEPAETSAEEVSSAPLVLVTGASGFVGSRVVARLLAGGYRVRALVRSESTSRLRGLSGVSLEVGDVRDPEAVARAVADVQWVVHAAADTTGTLEGGRETTIQGTRNVLEAARSAGTRRVAYVSSCSVYRYVGVPDGTVLQETSPLEPRPERRGPYSWAKTVADQEVERMAEAFGVDVVRLRPGLVYGPGGDPANPMVGLTLGGRLFLTIRRAGHRLPLVHVDDLAEAIVRVLERPEAGGQTFNVVDPAPVSKEEFVESVVRPAHPQRVYIDMPYGALYVVVALAEALTKMCRVRPPLTRYRLSSSQSRVTISARRLEEVVGWQPTRSMGDVVVAAPEGMASS